MPGHQPCPGHQPRHKRPPDMPTIGIKILGVAGMAKIKHQAGAPKWQCGQSRRAPQSPPRPAMRRHGQRAEPPFGPRWRVALRHHDGGTMRTWGGRFSGDTDARVADFTRSIEIDAALAADDIAGSIAHVRGLGRAGLLTDDEVGSLTDGLMALARDAAAGTLDWDPTLEDVHMNVEAALVREGRAAGRQAPHRAFAQRPGRDGPAPLDASGDRRPRSRAARVRARAGRPRGTRGDRGPARHDPHPAGPAGPVRPSPAGVRRDGRARSRPPGRCARPGRHLAARVRCARRGGLPARPRGDGARARVRWRDGQLARRGLRSRFRRRGARRGRARDGPPQPARGGGHVVVEPAVRVHRAWPTRSRPAAR